jgi:integrase
MAGAKRIPTRYPGIYKRGDRYTFRVNGRGRWITVDTLDEARDQQRTGNPADRRAASRQSFGAYALEWIAIYRGRTKRGFDAGTRDGYRRALERYAIPYFDKVRRRKIGDIEPRDVRAFADWLAEQRTPATKRHPEGRPLAQGTIRNAMAPVKALLATALEDGDIRSNPSAGVRIALAEDVQADFVEAAEQRRALTLVELGRLLTALPDDEARLMFDLLATTGVRWGEVAELRGGDVTFGKRPVLRVRRSWSAPRAGKSGRVKTPKSRYSRRDIPLTASVARGLWRLQRGPDELLFTTPTGERLRRENVYRRVLAPAAKTAGVEWAAFHTFRHTCASMLFAGGKNIKQVQEWLGHHSATFTLATYVHLMDDGLGDAGALDTALAEARRLAAEGGTPGVHTDAETDRNDDPGQAAENA